MSKTPVANYSAENVEVLKSVYGSANTDAERKQAVVDIAKQIGKTVNSVRAKLSGLKIYIKPKATNKAGVQTVRKNELVSQIPKEINVDEDLLASLENATKFALEKVMGHMLVQNRIIADLEAEPEAE